MFCFNHYLADNTELVVFFKNGNHVVYDSWELEVYEDNAEPLFTGHYIECVVYVNKCDTEAAESLF